MPKAHRKSTSSEEDEGYGYINPGEAKAHVDALEKVMTKIKSKIEQRETTDLLDKVLAELKEILSTLSPAMQLADTSTVSRSIRDKHFNALLPRSDEIEETLAGNHT